MGQVPTPFNIANRYPLSFCAGLVPHITSAHAIRRTVNVALSWLEIERPSRACDIRRLKINRRLRNGCDIGIPDRIMPFEPIRNIMWICRRFENDSRKVALEEFFGGNR